MIVASGDKSSVLVGEGSNVALPKVSTKHRQVWCNSADLQNFMLSRT